MVTLRSFTLEDAPALQRIVSGRTVRFTHGYDMTAEEAGAAVRRFIAHDQDDPRAHWNLGIDSDSDGDGDGDLIGLVKARLRDDGTAALSYLLREDTWGNGYATEAVKQFVPRVFADGVKRLEARHHPDNPASGRVLLKAGFVQTDATAPQQAAEEAVPPHLLYELRAEAPELIASPCPGRTEHP
ncbi:GCN5-related N-acetyltransferase [Actinobacteria bacterium OK074]|nr:GCN5-related N-acetyltransferase [Actinobacteria bacterium OK074]